MSGNGGMRGFWQALTNHTDSKYQGAQSSATLIVTRIDKDSNGGVLAAYGTLQGEGDTEFYMPLRGASAAVGDHLLGTYPTNNPAGGELTYVRHVFSNDPAAGLLVPDADLPSPQFATVPFTSALDASTGGISAYMVIYFIEVEARYQPSGYTISYRPSGGDWTDQAVPSGVTQARLSAPFPPGTYVDVKLRARYNWASAESIPTDPRTFRAALDDITPGDATAVIVETNTPGGLNIFAEGTLDPAHFDHWRYAIATSGGGAGLTIRDGNSPYFFTGASADYYVAASPVSKSGVVGGRYPGVGYAGPFRLNNPAQPLDTTPPPDWTSAPALAMQRVVTNNNGEQAQLTITLPTYPYPADYAETLVYVVTNTNTQAPTQRIAPGVGSTTLFVPFGTVSVTLRGLDKAGNLSANPSPAATAALQPSGAPQIAPTLVVSTFALAIKLDWNVVPYALAYEVQRAPNVNGAPGTFVDFASLDARMYLDTLVNETVVLPSYWYQVRAINALGSGPYSAYKQGFAGAVDARNLRLQSVTAAQIAADAIAANNIQAGAITAGKLAADLVIASNIRTANSGARVEIHGLKPGEPNPNQIRMIDNGEVLRAILNGTGLYYYNNAGSVRAQIDGQGVTAYAPGGLITLGDVNNDGLLLGSPGFSVAPGQVTHWLLGAGNVGVYPVRYHLSGGVNFFTLQRYDDTTMVYDPSMGGARIGYRATQLGFGGAGGALDAFIARSSAGVIDVIGSIRAGDGGAYVTKLQHTTANAHLDWSAGGAYIGWFNNPAQQVIVGNGAQGYGPIAASAFNVNSTTQDKQNIADPSGMWAKLAQLRPRAYQLKSDPTVTRYGFVAEEVAAIMPELVTKLPAAPYAGPVAPELLPQTTPALDVYGLVTAVAAGLVEAAKGATATIAAQAATIQGQGTKLGQAQARLTALEATVADLAARLAAVEAALAKVPGSGFVAPKVTG